MLGAGTVLFRCTTLDTLWASPWRDGTAWPHGDDPPWSWLYHFGTLPALLAVLAAVGGLLAGFRSARCQRFRRQAVYLILVMAIGPGLVANVLLKDHWGRPRPRDVLPLGGLQPFEPVLTIDPTSPGKSFPCGHATMGFFFIAFYFLLRRSHPLLARAALAAALLAGAAIGWARVVQGGHFPSDVLWAGGILWVLCALLACWLQPDRIPPLRVDFRPVSWPKLAVSCLLVPLLLFLGLLATPIDRKETFVAAAAIGPQPLEMRVAVPLGTTVFEPGDRPAASVRASGFGLPGGGLKSVWKESRRDDGADEVEFKQRVSGLNTEVDQDLRLAYPPDRLRRLRLAQPKGNVRLNLPGLPAAEPRRWLIELAAGDILVRGSGQPLRVRIGDREERDDPNPSDDVRIDAGPGVRVYVEAPLPQTNPPLPLPPP